MCEGEEYMEEWTLCRAVVSGVSAGEAAAIGAAGLNKLPAGGGGIFVGVRAAGTANPPSMLSGVGRVWFAAAP